MWSLKEVLQMNLFTKWKPEIENKFIAQLKKKERK